MKIASKLKLNVLLVLLFLVVNTVVSIYVVQRMMDDVRQLAEIEEPLKEAILEMEINASETAQAVFDYVWDHDEEDIEKIRDSERDFEMYAMVFDRLVETDKERELAGQVAELYRDFKRLGDEIVLMSSRRYDLLQVFHNDVMAIDELIDTKLQAAIDRSADDAFVKLEAALEMEINIDEAFAAIEGYVLGSSAEIKQKIADSEVDFERFMTLYRETRLSADEKQWLNQIDSDFAEAVIVGNDIIAITDQLRLSMEQFEVGLYEIDRILGDEIQVLIHAETARAAKDAQRVGNFAIVFMIGAGMFVVTTVAGITRVVSRGIVNATRLLSEGAVEFSRGNLAHRIDMKARDELGMVSQAFDTMAETLHQTTISRDELIEETHTRQLVEEELRKSKKAFAYMVEEEQLAKSQRQTAIEKLEVAATTDSLTGLSNRAVFMNRLDHAMKRSKRDGSRFAVLFFDFDRFKIVNDGLGHDVGDALLCDIADIFRRETRDSDTVARFGGDEFVVLLDCLTEWSDAHMKANRLLEALAEPHDISGHRIVSTASIGLVTNEHAHQCAADVIRDADAAMYEAKAEGRGRVVSFDSAMHDRAMSRLSLEADLRFAIAENQLRLVYQPIIILKTGAVSGFEALIRWDHPQRGVVSPIDFIPMAEETGLIVEIGQWVLRMACKQITDWNHRLGLENKLSINVNVSRRQFLSSSLVDDVLECLREFDMRPEELNLELTESAISDGRGEIVPLLLQLRELGVHIALDDFGTGVSSLSTLHEYPIDVLKIDQNFIRNLDGGRSLFAVVASVTALAENLGIQTVAEGIETESVVGALQSVGCTWGQGYYFAKPMAPADAEAYLLGIHKQKCGA